LTGQPLLPLFTPGDIVEYKGVRGVIMEVANADRAHPGGPLYRVEVGRSRTRGWYNEYELDGAE
jgi:hypothetical protein